jgi:mannose-6-phosphate isomerase-like protein (cupin superfamily)
MNIEKVNIKNKLEKFSDYWNPRIAGVLNGQHIKLVKAKGEFIWHKHDNEDEMFFVVAGKLKIEFRDHATVLGPDEFIIIPKGIEHRPVAEEEVSVMLFEPAGTLNTGDTVGKYTHRNLDEI